MSITVTVLDHKTGKSEATEIEDGDYFVVCTEPAWIDGIVTWRHGETHVITVKGRIIEPGSLSPRKPDRP